MTPDPILIDIPAELVGPRVTVRSYRPGDGRALWEAVNESRDRLVEWMPWAVHEATLEETEALVRRNDAKFRLREDLVVGIWETETGRFLGSSGLHRIDWNVRRFEVGYWIRSSAEGKGFVSESTELLCDMAFQALQAKRVFIRCAVENTRSAAIPKRLGFQFEGTLANDGIHNDGRPFDIDVFGMTPERWRSRTVHN